MIFVITAIVFSVIIFLGWWYYQFFKHLKQFKGPTPIPIFGNVYKIQSTSDILPALMDFIKAHGHVLKYWVGYVPKLLIADCKTAGLVFESSKFLDKSADYKFLHRWLGTGLLTSTGSKWRKHRKLLTPTFHFQMLDQYISIFNKEAGILVKKLNDVANESIDIYPFINLCSLDIIYESVMGLQINSQTIQNSEYVYSIKDINETIMYRMYSIIGSNNYLYKFTNYFRRENKALKIVHDHSNNVIKCREDERMNLKEYFKSEDDQFGRKRRLGFLDLLLESREAGAQLTNEEIREEVDTFMFEGHDTTGSGIAFTLYCLSLHKQYQDKVFEEISNTMNSDRERCPSLSELQNMKYLEMFIKESMRLYPPVPLIARTLSKDTIIDDAVVPKGTYIQLYIYGIHRQEEMFPDPEKFDPERFTIENSANRSPYAYVPFSAGLRNCIGQRFAMLFMKVVLSKILMNFEVLPVENYQPELILEAVLLSKNGVQVKLQPRKQNLKP